jgi:hypothetical protein
MNIESYDYTGYLEFRNLDNAALGQIEAAARENLGDLEIEIGPTHLEFDYSGRDTNRKVVRFLCQIAPLIGEAQGEIECRYFDDNGTSRFEIYTISDHRLYQWAGKILKHHKKEVCLDKENPHALAATAHQQSARRPR